VQDTPVDKSPAIPKGWRRSRRRRQRTFHEDFPTLSDKVRVFISLAFYGLTLATFFAGPLAIYTMAAFGWFAWDYDYKVTGLAILPPGLLFLWLGYLADPGVVRPKKRSGRAASVAPSVKER
jgi:hypothetical protein